MFLRFTIVAECLQQIRHQLNTLKELVLNFTYENDPITLNMSSLQEQVMSLFKSLLIKYVSFVGCTVSGGMRLGVVVRVMCECRM